MKGTSRRQKKFDKRMSKFLPKLPAEDIGKCYSKAELTEDLDYMLQLMEEVHPNLYFSFPKDAATSLINAIKETLSDGQNRIEFYFQLAAFVARFRDGHTNVHPPGEEFAQYKKGGGLRFPLDADCPEDKIRIVKSHLDQFTPSDSLWITSINGHSTQDILDTFLGILSPESEVLKREWISHNFAYFLFLLLGPTETFHLILEEEDGEKDITLPGVSWESYDKKREPHAKTDAPPYEYEIHRDEGYAVFDFRSFIDPDRFKSFIKDMFTEINAASLKNLIIDLRKNGGGYSMLIDTLVSYFTDMPFRQFSREDIKVSLPVRRYYSVLIPLLVRFPLNLLPARLLFRKLWKKPVGDMIPREFKAKRLKSGKPFFRGNVYVLTGPRTYSSASALATTIKDHNLGMIIGVPTGGYASSYGDCYPFTLPHTRLKCTVSHKFFVRPNGSESLEPLQPDYPVAMDASRPDADPVMEFAVQLTTT